MILLVFQQLELTHRATQEQDILLRSTATLPTDSSTQSRLKVQQEEILISNGKSALPYCKGDEYHIGKWVRADEVQTFDECSWIDHRNCIQEQKVTGRERIQKSMQWNWIPSSCKLHEFNSSQLIATLAIQHRRIFYFGDSLNEDMHTSLICMLGLEKSWEFTIGVREDFLGCPNKKTDPTHGTKEYCSDLEALTAVWRKHVDTFKMNENDILVINTGAHWYGEPEDAANAFVNIANAIAKVFKGHVVVRTTVMGHENCQNFEQPNPQVLPHETATNEHQSMQSLPYNWATFGRLNDLIQKAVEGSNLRNYQILYVDMFEQRPDGHYIGDKEDCLHYCVPGPINWWNKLLFHILYDTVLFPTGQPLDIDTTSMTIALAARNAELRNERSRIAELYHKNYALDQHMIKKDSEIESIKISLSTKEVELHGKDLAIKQLQESLFQLEAKHNDLVSLYQSEEINQLQRPLDAASTVEATKSESALPFCRGDEYRIGTWIKANIQQSYATCSWNEHRNCMMWNHTEEKRVQDSMQWNWVPSYCRLRTFNGTKVQDALERHSRRLIFLGDSINEDMSMSLRCMIGGGLRRSGHRTFNSRFDFFGCTKKWNSDPLFGTDQYCMNTTELDEEWTRISKQFHLTSRDILVLDSGPLWYVKPEYAAAAFYNIANAIAKVFQGHVVYRSTVMGHDNCQDYDGSTVSKTWLPESVSNKENHSASWKSFQHLDKLIAESFAKSKLTNFQVLHVDMFEQRPDGHDQRLDNNEPDCRHYCVPGPVEWWNKLLYHNLYDKLGIGDDPSESSPITRS